MIILGRQGQIIRNCPIIFALLVLLLFLEVPVDRSPGTVPARQVLPVAAVDDIFYQYINISLIFILDAILLNSGHFSNCYITTAKS